MFLLPGASKTGQHLVKSACRHLKKDYRSLVDRAVIISIPLPAAVHRLDDRYSGGKLHGYAMCLNHWLRFLPFPVILLNAEWLGDDEKLRQSYREDASSGYHPACYCPVRYIIAHEIGHYVYVQMGREKREQWKRSFEPGKPSGYSTTPEEGFCEAFAGYTAGLRGIHFERVATLIKP